MGLGFKIWGLGFSPSNAKRFVGLSSGGVLDGDIAQGRFLGTSTQRYRTLKLRPETLIPHYGSFRVCCHLAGGRGGDGVRRVSSNRGFGMRVDP